MQRVKTGQIIESGIFQRVRHLSLNDSIGPGFTDVCRLWEIVTIKQVLCKMLLGMLVAIAHEAGIQRLSLRNPVEAIESRQIFFTELFRQLDKFSVHLIGFREDIWPGSIAVLLEDDRVELLKMFSFWLRLLPKESLQPQHEALTPEIQL